MIRTFTGKRTRSFYGLTHRFLSLGRQQGPLVINDDLSVTHAKLLETSLHSHIPKSIHQKELTRGSPLPLGWHLIYFNHAVPEDQLSVDGYDNLQAPDVKNVQLLRRWVGGKIEFNNKNPLRLGDDAICTESTGNTNMDTNSPGAVGGGSSKNRYNVMINREMRKRKDPSEVSIKESRTLYYFEASKSLLRRMARLVSGRPVNVDEMAGGNKAYIATHEFVATNLLLFRYSALSFNAHLIHYDPEYAKQVEGLDGIVAQGPLMVTIVLRWLSSIMMPHLEIKSMSYENLGSIIAGDALKLHAVQISDSKWQSWVTRKSSDGAERIVLSADVWTQKSDNMHTGSLFK